MCPNYRTEQWLTSPPPKLDVVPGRSAYRLRLQGMGVHSWRGHGQPAKFAWPMEHSQTTSRREQIESLLPFLHDKARAVQSEISVSGSGAHLRRVAAASLFRVPRSLRAVLLLADSNMSIEANTICRTILELAIESCWIGTDEARASRVWNKFVKDQQRGMIRFGTFTKTMLPPSENYEKRLNEIPFRPNLPKCAYNAIDTAEFRAKTLAVALHELYYDSLSAGAHGDLRWAVTLVQRNNEADLVDEALEVAFFASVTLLCSTSLQLGFPREVEAFLDAHGLDNPFSRQ